MKFNPRKFTVIITTLFVLSVSLTNCSILVAAVGVESVVTGSAGNFGIAKADGGYSTISGSRSEEVMLSKFASIANRLADKLEATGKKRIVVAYYSDIHGRVSTLGRLGADLLNAGLVDRYKKSFQVINRRHLEAIIKEHKLGLTGLIKHSETASAGKFLGADIIIVGTFVPFNHYVLVISKGIAPDTGRIVFADHELLARTQTIDELLHTGISGRDIFRNMPMAARFSNPPAFRIDDNSVHCAGYGVFRTLAHAKAKYCHERPRSVSSDMTCRMYSERKWERMTRFCSDAINSRLLKDLGINPDETRESGNG